MCVCADTGAASTQEVFKVQKQNPRRTQTEVGSGRNIRGQQRDRWDNNTKIHIMGP